MRLNKVSTFEHISKEISLKVNYCLCVHINIANGFQKADNIYFYLIKPKQSYLYEVVMCVLICRLSRGSRKRVETMLLNRTTLLGMMINEKF